jgi:hypothetical protein
MDNGSPESGFRLQNKRGPLMNENSKAPTSTTPMGNTSMKPSVLERGIGENAAAKLREHHPEQHKRMREHLQRKRTESGHARG